MNEWFINLLLIILPFFLYHLFLLEKPKAEFQLKDNDMFLAVTFVQVLLCMHFPLFTFGNGIQLDVRAVPFIVGFLYGGKRIGWILLVAVLGHRAIIGGDGFYSSVMTYTLIASFLNVIQPKFERQPSWQKYLTLLGVNLFFIFLVLFSLTAIHHFNRSWSVIIPITAFQTGCLWLIVYIIEKMKKNIWLREQLHRMEKMNLIGEMAMSVSHEMRNPLTVAKGFLQMLGNEPVLSAEKKQQYINYALNELQRTDDIIHTYMNMVEADSNLLSAFNLRAELEHILAALEPFANIRHVKIYSKAEGDFWVYSEKKLLRKCLTYMIQLRLEMLPPGSILNLRLDGVQSYVRLTLSDRGENTARGQSGLRMMFVIGMLNSLNADIRIRKQKHKGTRISISVPLYRAQMLKENKNSKHSL